MQEPQLGYFFPVSAGHPGHPLPEPPGGGNKPALPIQLPPLPPWFDGKPPVLPPSVGGGPIIPDYPVVSPIPPTPGQPLPQPPGQPPTVGGGPITPEPPNTVWPPLDPSGGLGGSGKYIVLIHIFGVGNKWLIYDANVNVTPPIAPTPSPK